MSSARICCLAIALLLNAGGAKAQSGESAATLAASPGSVSLSYLEYRRHELEYLSGRPRIGVISSSAVVAAGVALVVPAAVKECVRVASSASFDELRCTSAGKALLGVGVPLLVGGATAVLATAIMLGVRRGKIRHIDDQLAYEKHRAMRWDPERFAFAF